MQRNEPITDEQRRMRGDLAHEYADAMKFKGGTCGCKELLVLRVHAVAASRHKLLDKSQVTHASRLVDSRILHSGREDG